MQNTEARLSFDARCLKFGVAVLKLAELLPRNPRGKHVADQLMRSGTSVGANVQEAQAAQSRADFVHKMHVALKEAREAAYWLNVVLLAAWINDSTIPLLLDEGRQIAAILAQSIITAKRNGVRQ